MGKAERSIIWRTRVTESRLRAHYVLIAAQQREDLQHGALRLIGLKDCIEREVRIAGLSGDSVAVPKGAVGEWSHVSDTTGG